MQPTVITIETKKNKVTRTFLVTTKVEPSHYKTDYSILVRPLSNICLHDPENINEYAEPVTNRPPKFTLSLEHKFDSNGFATTESRFGSTIILPPGNEPEKGMRGFGIGTYMLSKLLSMAAEDFPKAKGPRITLSNVDSKDVDNGERRNKMYSNLGFILDIRDENGLDGFGQLKTLENFTPVFNKDKIKEESLEHYIYRTLKEKSALTTKSKAISNLQQNIWNQSRALHRKNIQIFLLFLVASSSLFVQSLLI